MNDADNVAPHSLEAERSVLGAILIDNEAFSIAVAEVRAGDFFRDAHAKVLRHFATMRERGEPIDLVTLNESLRGSGDLEDCGGPAYIASLIDGVPHTTNVAYYARIVREHAARRTLINSCRRIVQQAHISHEPLENLVAAASAEIQLVSGTSQRDSGLFLSAADTCNDQHDVPMLLAPYVPSGAIGSVIAKIKTGKTSVLLEMVRCVRGASGFCGYSAPPAPVRVLYATEQPRASFAKQLHDAGLQEDDGVIVTYLSAWKGKPWAQIAPRLVDEAISSCAELLVIDTGSQWFGFKEDQENQSGSAMAVQLLQPFVAKGGAVLISRHGRKSGGSASDAGRGTSALEGAVDYIIHLTKPSSQPAEVREIEAVGRFDMPDRLQIRRKANFQLYQPIEIDAMTKLAPRYVFEAITTQADTPRARIRVSLGRGRKTVKELADDLSLSVPTITRTLEDMAGEVVQVGKGGPRNNATIYGLKAQTTTSSSQSLSDEQVESFPIADL